MNSQQKFMSDKQVFLLGISKTVIVLNDMNMGMRL